MKTNQVATFGFAYFWLICPAWLGLVCSVAGSAAWARLNTAGLAEIVSSGFDCNGLDRRVDMVSKTKGSAHAKTIKRERTNRCHPVGYAEPNRRRSVR